MASFETTSACIVTRGNVDLQPILESLAAFDEVVIYDNSRESDVAVYGRYVAAGRARHPVVYVQDDDVVVPPDSIRVLIAAYEPGVVVANVPQRFRGTYPVDGSRGGIVGLGAVFDRDLPERAFAAMASLPRDDQGRAQWLGYPVTNILAAQLESHNRTSGFFQRRCDNLFTVLTPIRMIDLPCDIQSFAYGADRMCMQPGHTVERDQMIRLAQQVRDS